MAIIYFKCNCQKVLAVDETGAGKTVNCPDCGKPIKIPVPEIEWECSCGKTMLAPFFMSNIAVQCVDCKKSIQVPAAETTAPSVVKCPYCKASIQPNSVICVNCGLNFKTGQRIKPAETTTLSKRVPIKPVIIAASVFVVVGIAIAGWMQAGRKVITVQSTPKVSSNATQGGTNQSSKAQSVEHSNKETDNIVNGMSENEYFQYLKVIADNANDSAGINKAQNVINTYLTAFPKGKNKSSVIAYQEILQGKRGQLAFESIQPLMNEYEAINSGFSSGISYISFCEAYRRATAQYNKLKAIIEGTSSSEYSMLKKIQSELDLVKSFWDSKILIDKQVNDGVSPTYYSPKMADASSQALITAYPLLKDVGVKWRDEDYFSYALAVSPMMSYASKSISEARSLFSSPK